MMRRNYQKPQKPPPKKLVKINLEEHIDYWEEARALRRHYFLNTMDIDLTQITNWLINNSKYMYDTTDFGGLKDLYLDICDALLEVRTVFNYEKIGKIIGFLISDDRFYIKPFAFPKMIREVCESFVLLSKRWNEIVLKTFTFPYKTLLSVRYEIQNFLLYLSLEGCAQRIVEPKSKFSVLVVMQSCLSCLELPMSLYFDSFHLRKLLNQISLKLSPALALHCIHPVITQLQYVFQLYYKNIQLAWKSIDELQDFPLTKLGFSYMIHNLLVDNYNIMVYWKINDYKGYIEKIIKPKIVNMVHICMPLDVINKLLVQGFYDIIEEDCNCNFLRRQFDSITNDVNQWEELVDTWNTSMAFSELTVSKDKNVIVQSFLSILFDRGMIDWDYAYLCLGLVRDFFSDRVGDGAHAQIILSYFCSQLWISDNTLHNQIRAWFQRVLDDHADLGISTSSLSSDSIHIVVKSDLSRNSIL